MIKQFTTLLKVLEELDINHFCLSLTPITEIGHSLLVLTGDKPKAEKLMHDRRLYDIQPHMYEVNIPNTLQIQFLKDSYKTVFQKRAEFLTALKYADIPSLAYMFIPRVKGVTVVADTAKTSSIQLIGKMWGYENITVRDFSEISSDYPRDV